MADLDEAPVILNIAQVKALLGAAAQADPGLALYVALGLFAGLRPEREAARLLPGDINGEVLVRGLHAKCRQRRMVPIQPALAAWLAVPYGDFGTDGTYRGGQFSTTEYTVTQIGPDRDHTEFQVDTVGNPNGWQAWFLQSVTNTIFSDVTFGPGHGNRTAIGSNAGETAGATAIQAAASSVGTNWCLRKIALWSCLAASFPPGGTNVPPLPAAFGIRSGPIQMNGIMRKNVGLFFENALNQQANNAEMEYGFDKLWVTGPNAYPGGCDPTYSFNWAVNKAKQRYAFWNDAGPTIIGCPQLPYTGIYDDMLATNNFYPVSN